MTRFTGYTPQDQCWSKRPNTKSEPLSQESSLSLGTTERRRGDTWAGARFRCKITQINGPGAFWAYVRSLGCARRLGILIQSANLASPGAFWPYIRSFGCAKCLKILIQSANLASTVAILSELVTLGAQTGIVIGFTLLQKPVCGPISVAIHPSIHASVHRFMHAAVRSSIHVSIYPSIHSSIHPSMHASMHPSASQSTSLWL